jgi:CRISPR-associated protein Cas1
MSAPLLPISYVAEFIFCPRFFYLLRVENWPIPETDFEKESNFNNTSYQTGIDGLITSTFGPQANLVHQMAFSSETLGVAANLDFIKLDGARAVLVEFRSNAPKTVEKRKDFVGEEEIVYRPCTVDFVLIGLKALLLEESILFAQEAIIFYNNKKISINIDTIIKSKSLEILTQARKCMDDLRPSPLLNDLRCSNCSLYQICLPYETNYAKQLDYDTQNIQPEIRLWPPNDEGIHIVTQREGAKISVNGNELKFTDKNGITIRNIPLVNIVSLNIIGFVQITTQAIHVLSEKQVSIAFSSSSGRLISIIESQNHVSALVRRSQVRNFDDEKKRLELAQCLIYAKIKNQHTIIKRNCNSLSDKDSEIFLSIAQKVMKSKTLDELRGYEGYIATIYFRNLGNLIQSPLVSQFIANGRKRRPPPDPVNACLSLAYSILAKECITALRLASLEPTLGAYHVALAGRPALALDLMEPFRPLIADSTVIICFNKKELSEKFFTKTASGCNLTREGLNIIYNEFNRRMKTEKQHHIFNYKLSYRTMLDLHSKMIAAWLVGDLKDLSFLVTR